MRDLSQPTDPIVMISEVEVINLQNAPVQYIDVSDMPVSQKIVLKRKLMTELTHVRTRIENIGEVYDRLLVNEFPGKDHIILEEACSSYKNQDMMSRKRKFPEVSKQHKDAGNISYNEEDFAVEKSEAVSTVTGAFEGDSPGRLDSQNEKGRKMDISKIKQCCNVLKTLMNHQYGWVFNQPVDPVELCIPDYFSIIKKPMDLGTVKDKLERKRYSSTHQFAADVRLTFSNAMRYNPPRNDVHMMAKNLNNIFNAKWKSLEFKWRKESPISSQQSVRKITKKQAVASDQVLQRIPSCNSSTLSSKSLNTADKLKMQNSLEKMSGRNMPPPLYKFLQKTGLLEQCEDKINLDMDELDEATLWELHQIIGSCGDAEPANSAGLVRNSQDLMKACSKGTGGTRDTSGFTNIRVRTTPSACINSNHPYGTDCPCNHHNNFTQASFSDGDSDRSSCRQNLPSQSTASDMDGDNISGVHGHKGSSDTVGRIGTAIVDLDSAQHTSYPSSPAAASPLKESEFPCDSHLSPSRALRAAMLKSRFADTILKAQHRTLLNHGEKSDPARMQREKERLEKKQQEEKARIEAQIRAAEAAVRMKVEAERKMQREREREAARLALQKIEKTVDIDENSQIFKELENLGYPQPVHLDLPDDMAENFMDVVEQQAALANPLAQLGLFMKEDDLDEEVDNWISSTGYADAEEGEIGSS